MPFSIYAFVELTMTFEFNEPLTAAEPDPPTTNIIVLYS